MKILQNISDNNLLLNGEVNFRPDLGWEDGMQEFEKETLKSIINPAVNFETVRYIHSGYTRNNIFQSDIWFYFYFFNGQYPPVHELDYLYVGLSIDDNVKILRHTDSSFFRLEFYKTPEGELPNSGNRKLVFTKHLPIPLGEKINYAPTDSNIFVPVFTGSNYRNKENMYLFWFQDYSVLNGTSFSGDTFYMTTKFFNNIDGDILPFSNKNTAYNASIDEEVDVYHRVVINRTDYSYVIYSGNTNIRIGTSDTPIRFYCSAISSSTFSPPPLPSPSSSPGVSATPSVTPVVTPSRTATPTPTPTITATPTPTRTVTPTVTPTITATPSRTVPIQHCVTPTPSTSTTPSISVSVTPSVTPSITTSVSMSVTPSLSPGASPSATPSVTPSIVVSPSRTVTPTPTITPTVTMTPSITPSTSMVIYSICATNQPYFNGYSSDLVGELTVGDVLLTSGSITDYAIEWHLNSVSGTTVFLSGSGSDPNLQALHPLNSELVQAGLLYPVFRYINVNGILYSAYSNLGYRYSPDLATCLPSINVQSMSCSNGNTGGTYDHTVSYVNTTQPSSVANRSLAYNLNTDGSTEMIAWLFQGYAIADRLTIKYVSNSGATETVLQDWVIGSDCTGYTFDSLPYLYQAQYLYDVLNLSGITYSLGDYLLFNVTPGYNNPGNTDTNWQLNIKCFTTENPFDCNFAPNSCQTITGSTAMMVYNTGSCRFELSVQTGDGPAAAYQSDLYTYYQNGFSASGSWDWSSVQTIYFNQYTGVTTTWEPNNGYGQPFILNGVLNIFKTGSTLYYTFTNSVDYLFYKNSYTARTASDAWAEYSSDPSSLNHFIMFYDYAKVSMTSGDTGTSYQLIMAHDSIFSFDDTNRIITVNPSTLTSNLVDYPCFDQNSSIGYYVGFINDFATGATFNYNTIWGAGEPFAFLSWSTYIATPQSPQDLTVLVTLQTVFAYNNLVCDFQPNWIKTNGYYPNTFVWTFNKVYLRGVITDLSDPINNWELYSRFILPDGTVDEEWTLIAHIP